MSTATSLRTGNGDFRWTHSLCNADIHIASRELGHAVHLNGAPLEAVGALSTAERLTNAEFLPEKRERSFLSGMSSTSFVAFDDTKAMPELYCWDGSILMNKVFLHNATRMEERKVPPQQLIEAVSRYISRSPALAGLYIIRGKAHLEIREYAAAIYDFKAAQQQRCCTTHRN
jgi:hypothetical protein